MRIRGVRTGEIWGSTAFRRLWSAAAISAAGDQVSKLALPIIAIGTLHAGPFEVGLLLTVEQLPQLLFALIAGAWIDRLPKRRVLLICDAGRAAVLLLLPIGAAFDRITLPLLFVVGFVAGIFTTWHMIAWQSMLPLITRSDQLVPATSAIGQVESIVEVGGPFVGGGLIELVGAPTAVLIDAVSFAASARLIQQLPPTEVLRQSAHPPVLGQIREGVRYLLREPALRAIGLSGAVGVFFFSLRDPLLRVFLLDTKGLSAGRYGLIFTAAAVGYAIGSFLPGPVARKIGVGDAILWPHLGFGLAGLGVALAVTLDQRAPLWIALMLLLEGVFEPINNVNQLALRLTLMPQEMRGRLTSVVRFLIRGAYPLGAFAGGLVGQLIGIRAGIWLSALGVPLGAACYLGSNIRQYRHLPALPD